VCVWGRQRERERERERKRKRGRERECVLVYACVFTRMRARAQFFTQIFVRWSVQRYFRTERNVFSIFDCFSCKYSNLWAFKNDIEESVIVVRGVTYECVMTHTWTRLITHVDESWHTHSRTWSFLQRRWHRVGSFSPIFRFFFIAIYLRLGVC